MPVMSAVEGAWCRSAPWRAITGRVVFPWVFGTVHLSGDVLEIGSGSGANAVELLRHAPGARLTATDVDPAMLAAARRRLEPHRHRATVLAADATRLPFPDGSFDAVLSLLMLHHVIDWQDAVAEVRRVLRPGGVVVGYDMMQSAVARAVHRLDRSPHRMVASDELRHRLIEVGFGDPKVSDAFGGIVARFRAVR